MVNVSQLDKNFDHAKTQQMEFFFDEVMPSQIKLALKATANVKQLITLFTARAKKNLYSFFTTALIPSEKRKNTHAQSNLYSQNKLSFMEINALSFAIRTA